MHPRVMTGIHVSRGCLFDLCCAVLLSLRLSEKLKFSNNWLNILLKSCLKTRITPFGAFRQPWHVT